MKSGFNEVFMVFDKDSYEIEAETRAIAPRSEAIRGSGATAPAERIKKFPALGAGPGGGVGGREKVFNRVLINGV